MRNRITSMALVFALVTVLVCSLAGQVLAAHKPGTDFETETGLGFDSNVYLSPDGQYDYNPVGGPLTVNSTVQSGLYIPLYLRAGFSQELEKDRRLVGEFKFRGRFYLDPDNENANEHKTYLNAGLVMVLGRDADKEDTLYIGPSFAIKKEVYFDRETGGNMLSPGGTDISDRYEYSSMGLRTEYAKRTVATPYKLFLIYENRDYTDPVVFRQYDHTYYRLGGEVDFHLSESSMVELRYQYRVRDYDERFAADLTGIAAAGNPVLKYTYHEPGASLRHRISPTLVSYLDYDLRLRTDNFEGYGDYMRNRFRVRTIYDNDRDLRVRLALAYWLKSYDKADTYNNPAEDNKEFSNLDFSLDLDRRIGKRTSLVFDADYEMHDSTDNRYIYDRYMVMLGVNYEM